MKNARNLSGFKGKKSQQGNYLLSIGMGIMVMAILAVWGVPKIKDYLIEGAIPSVAEETQRFIAKVKINSAGSGTDPFTGLDQEYFARAVRGGSLQVGDVSGQGTGGEVVRHGLGGGSAGTIEISETGDSFALTFENVNQAACPSLATALQRTVDDISINGTAVKTTDDDMNVELAYIASTAASACSDGDVNEFIFTIKN